MNETLIECARCMIEDAKLSKGNWGEAVLTAAFNHDIGLQRRPSIRQVTILSLAWLSNLKT